MLRYADFHLLRRRIEAERTNSATRFQVLHAEDYTSSPSQP